MGEQGDKVIIIGRLREIYIDRLLWIALQFLACARRYADPGKEEEQKRSSHQGASMTNLT